MGMEFRDSIGLPVYALVSRDDGQWVIEMTHVDFAVKKKCWNLYDSYGEICVCCGCCAEDKKTRYESRIECLERWIAEKKDFRYWADDPELRKVQERNIAEDLKYWKSRLWYYRNKLAKLGTATQAKG